MNEADESEQTEWNPSKQTGPNGQNDQTKNAAKVVQLGGIEKRSQISCGVTNQLSRRVCRLASAVFFFVFFVPKCCSLKNKKMTTTTQSSGFIFSSPFVFSCLLSTNYSTFFF